MYQERLLALLKGRTLAQHQPEEQSAKPNTMLLLNRMITTIGRGYEIHGSKLEERAPETFQAARRLAEQIARASEREQAEVNNALENLRIHQQGLGRVNDVPDYVGMLIGEARATKTKSLV